MFIFSHREMLKKGNTQDWTKTLGEFMEMQGDGSMSSESILAYFKPLEDWLDVQLNATKYEVTMLNAIVQYKI